MASSTFLQSARRTAVRTVVTGVAIVGAVEVTTHLPSQGRSSEFYHYLSDKVALPLLRRTLDPETAHKVGLELAKRGLAPTFYPSAVEQAITVSSRPFPLFPNLTFDNCIGLAAGFDKDGEAIQAMMDMGFGFVEIGSVTPLPQEGNPKPRMFRLAQDRGIINRYGFNSKGMDVVEENLQAYRTPPSSREESSSLSTEQANETILKRLMDATRRILEKPAQHSKGVLGVNLGKNKTSEDELADYRMGIAKLGPYADYLVINVSSPNTPGLRELQKAEALRRLLNACVEGRDALNQPVPLLVKIAPDLSDTELQDIAKAVVECGVDGMVVCNTTMSRPSTVTSPDKGETGGLSGAPLRDISTEIIRKLYAATQGNVPIIGVGGVASGHDVYEKLKAGACLVEIYSMMVYEGPGVVSRTRRELAELMVQNGQRRVEDVVGLDHDDIYWKKREERSMQQRSQEKVYVVE